LSNNPKVKSDHKTITIKANGKYAKKTSLEYFLESHFFRNLNNAIGIITYIIIPIMKIEKKPQLQMNYSINQSPTAFFTLSKLIPINFTSLPSSPYLSAYFLSFIC
jgi:hypothetical protein